MDTFGDRLKSEREDRGLSIEAVAEILHVDENRLRALEHNDFDALPGERKMLECLHAYAKCLDVDAELMIEDYLGERDKWLRGLETAAERRPRFSPWLIALVVVAIAILAAWWMLSRDGTAPTPETSVAAAPAEPQSISPETPADVTPTPVELQPVSPKTPADVTPTPAEPQPLSPKTPTDVAPTPAEPQPPATRSAEMTPVASSLSITEYGVGTAVENRELVGQSDRFTEGTRVWFWTRVQGGALGDTIDHVWLREGVEVMHISLEIGGPNWRTYSTQTLHAGLAGDWATEARDAAGRVLVRSDFVCVR